MSTQPKIHAPLISSVFQQNAENWRYDVPQGQERISVFNPLVSMKFTRCSALFMINALSGMTFLKHIGPQAHEVVFGNQGFGKNFQAEADLFMQLTQKYGGDLVLLPIYGDLSYEHHNLIKEIKSQAEYMHINMQQLPDMRIPSGEDVWSLSYEPQTVRLIIKRYLGDNQVYEEKEIPGIDISKFDKNIADKIQHDLKLEAERNSLRSDIIRHIKYQNPDDLRNALDRTQEIMNMPDLSALYRHKFTYGGELTSIMKSCAHKAKWTREYKPTEMIQCIEILRQYDAQNDSTRDEYINLFMDLARYDATIEVCHLAIAHAHVVLGEFEDKQQRNNNMRWILSQEDMMLRRAKKNGFKYNAYNMAVDYEG